MGGSRNQNSKALIVVEMLEKPRVRCFFINILHREGFLVKSKRVHSSVQRMMTAIILAGLLVHLPMAEAAPEGTAYEATDKTSLYARMGGYDVISKVIDDFLTKSWVDPRIAHFFRGMGTDTRNQLRQKNKNLMCASTGGPCKVINRPLETVHEGLNITDKEFYIIVNHIAVSLETFNVPEKERQEVLAKVVSLKPKVVIHTEGPLTPPTREGLKDNALKENELGTANYKIGRFEEAFTHYHNASEEDPGVGEYQFNEGLILDKLGKHSQAALHFESAKKHAEGNSLILGSEVLKAHSAKMQGS